MSSLKTVTVPAPTTNLRLAPWQGEGKQPSRDSVHTAIERFVALGMRVVPVFGLDRHGHCTCRKGAKCNAAGKHPNPSFKAATTDATQIARWFDSGTFANLGVACGEFADDSSCTFFVLDIDIRNNGDVTLEQWIAEHGALPPTFEVNTGGGGKHYYFRMEGAEAVRSSAGALGEGIDIKGRGGFVVSPPSLHRSGDNYTFAGAANDAAIADAPDWLVEKIRSCRSKARVKYDPQAVQAKLDTTTLSTRLALVKKELAKRPSAVEDGTGERTTFHAGSLGHAFGVPIDDFMPLMEAYGDKCEPPWDHDELREKVEHAYEYNDEDFPFGWRLSPPVERDGRRIFVNSQYDAENVDNLFRELAKRDNIFVFNQRLARLVRTPSERPRPELYTAITLQDDASRIVAWVSEGKDGESKTHYPPKSLFEMAVSRRDGFGGVPVLRAIVEHPFFRPDGSIVATPGFDEATGVYLATSQPFDVPATATREDALQAWGVLRDLVSDFQFRGDADRAAWLAFALTPLARFAFEGLVPLMLFDAPVPGAGKGLLLDVASLIALGRTVPRAMLAPDHAEQRKLITSVLATAPEVHLFDNVTAGVGGPVIEGLITAPLWADRLLSKNEMTTIRNDTIWCVTANNAKIEGDAARRILCIRIAPDVERPETRTFKRPNLLQYVKAERYSLLRAAMVILRAYFDVGATRAEKLSPWGSFEAWLALVGNCVHWVTGVDPTSNRSLLTDGDADSELSAELVAALHEHGEVSAAQIASAIVNNDHEWNRVKNVIAELIPTRPNAAPTVSQISRKLSMLRDRVFNGLRLVYGRQTKKRFWYVEVVPAKGGQQ